jgi:hypothetical protein
MKETTRLRVIKILTVTSLTLWNILRLVTIILLIEVIIL